MAYSDTIKTADDVVNGGIIGQANDVEDALRQAALNESPAVTHSEYIGYDAALTAYEGRDDVEPLAERRAREIADDFSDQDFRREGTGSIAVITSPGDGNIG